MRTRLNQILGLLDYPLLYFSLFFPYSRNPLFHQPRVNDARGHAPVRQGQLARLLRVHARVHVHD